MLASSHASKNQKLLCMAAYFLFQLSSDNQKAKTVHHLDVAGHNKLKDKSLANIILGTEDTKHQKFYQYLYPDLLQSEALFSQYSSSGMWKWIGSKGMGGARGVGNILLII